MSTTPLPLSSQPAALSAVSLRRYGLRKQPFATVADTDSHYSDLALEMPVKTLLNHLHTDQWLLVFSGDHGVGKSTQLLRLIAAGADTLLFCAFKARPDASYAVIEQTIRQHWTKPVQRHANTALRDILCRLCHGQRRPVLVVDDAHQLKPDVLGELLQLSRDVLQHCGRTPGLVLAGEPYLQTLLEHSAPSHIPLQTSVSITLRPLTLEQTEAYLRLRLQAAGAKNPDLLSGPIAQTIYRESRGYPAAINAAANRYLQGSETPSEQTPPTPKVSTAPKPTAQPTAPSRPPRRRFSLPITAAALTVVLATTGGIYWALARDMTAFNPSNLLALFETPLPEPSPEPRVTWPQTVSPEPMVEPPLSEPEPVAATPPESEPKSESVAATDPEPEPNGDTSSASEPVAATDPEPEPNGDTSSASESVAATDPESEPFVETRSALETVVATEPESRLDTPPEPDTVATTDPEPEPSTDALPEPDTVAATDPEPEPSTDISPEPDTVATTDPEPLVETQPEPVAEAARPAEPEPTPPATTAAAHIDAAALTPIPVPTGGLLSEVWLQQQNPRHFTIQIAASNDRQALRAYAESLDLPIEVAWFRTLRNGQDWYSLVVGQYPSSASAQAAIANLPVRIRRNQPWIRNFGSIHRDIDSAQ